ncbi:PAS domain-containing protein [Curvivirga aplysinae]|uniref:PAS domain-containing protein n=1 Tax=Curvivirga aplysinae TaxID=2529852 RepID=UPI0012BC77D4|nr:PAS domain-containing protein [Curvivirga aplysinae]MTI10578.1 PAS domain-containing protein [Curvivirga aplysinae]
MYSIKDLKEGPATFPTRMSNEIYQAWLNFAPDKKIPARNDIDPLSIPKKYISNVWIYEYVTELNTYRQTLAGQNIKDAWQETKNCPLISDFMDSESVESVMTRWKFIRETPAAAYYSVTTDDEFKYTERIYLPMCDKYGDVNYIFGCSIYERLRGTDAALPPLGKDPLLFKID